MQSLVGGVALWFASVGRSSPTLPPLSCATFPATASLAQLRTALATSDIGLDSVPLGATEGDMVPATVFFATDSMRRIEIVWKDSATKTRPRFVRIARGPTSWRTPEGITIGTPLRELERLNKRPFHLAGFGFDEAGAVTSWDGGRLSALTTGSCQLAMRAASLSAESQRSARYRTVVGDRQFSSSMPAMQSLNPRVSSLLLSYP